MRIKSGLTQADLAARLGVGQSYISKIERGELGIDLIELRRICIALNTDIVDFVREFNNALAAHEFNTGV